MPDRHAAPRFTIDAAHRFAETIAAAPPLPGRARCTEHDPDWWWPEDTRRDETQQRIAFAIGQCVQCPVRAHCARNAIDAGETEGIWAGVLLDPKQSESTRHYRRLQLKRIANHQTEEVPDGETRNRQVA